MLPNDFIHPLPVASGEVWGILKIQTSPSEETKFLIATIRKYGKIIVSGRTRIESSTSTTLELRASEPSIGVPDPDTMFEICLNTNAQGWPSPAYGDESLSFKIRFPGQSEPILTDTVNQWNKQIPKGEIITIHYHRLTPGYTTSGLWVWTQDDEVSGREIFPVAQDDYGIVFQIDRSDFGEHIGVLPRINSDWRMKDGKDRFLSATASTFFLMEGSNQVFLQAPDRTPHFRAAYQDAPNLLTVQTSHPLKEYNLQTDTLQLADQDSRLIGIQKIEIDESIDQQFLIHTSTPLDPSNHTYTLLSENAEKRIQIIPRRVFDDTALYFSPEEKLGINYEKEKTTFRIFAPGAKEVFVVLYKHPTGEEGQRFCKMERVEHGIWELEIPENLEGYFYTFRIDAPGLNAKEDVTDIYATNTVDSSRRARITDLPKTTPEHFSENIVRLNSPVDAILYELHIRDFTIAESSGVQNKGLYLGFSESGTTHPSHPDIKTGLDHLTELGVTHVQLLPVQDFDNNESASAYNWGYITNAFNSPEGIYAGNPNDDSRIRELKTLIAALHERGIGVILDVVYNHTGSGATFDKIVPEYYYRILPNGEYADGSGVGNEFRTEAPMARKFLIDSLCYWVEEYGVDGFRFDLMALLDIESMRQVEQALRKIRPDILLYGEPWQAGGSPLQQLTNKTTLIGTKIGAFNDEFRNALKGTPNGQEPGFLQRGFERSCVEKGMEGSIRLWGLTPEQSINYMTCHDNLVLYDKLKISHEDHSEAFILRMMKLGYFLLLTAQGIPFLHGGEEFARTKFGNHNSYKAPDSINQIDWDLKHHHFSLFNYVKRLIALRKAHPLFRLRSAEEIGQRLVHHYAPTADTILYTIDGSGLEGESWSKVCLLINGGRDFREFILPKGKWKVAFNFDGLTPAKESFGGNVKMPSKAGLVLRLAD